MRGRNVGASSSCGPSSATPPTHCVFFPPLRTFKSRGGSLGGCFPGVCGWVGGLHGSSARPCAASDLRYCGGGSQHTPPKKANPLFNRYYPLFLGGCLLLEEPKAVDTRRPTTSSLRNAWPRWTTPRWVRVLFGIEKSRCPAKEPGNRMASSQSDPLLSAPNAPGVFASLGSDLSHRLPIFADVRHTFLFLPVTSSGAHAVFLLLIHFAAH